MVTTIDIKSDIHRLIDNINDIDFLNAIIILLVKQPIKALENDFWDGLPDFVKRDIDISIKQANEGKLHSHNEVMQRIKSKY